MQLINKFMALALLLAPLALAAPTNDASPAGAVSAASIVGTVSVDDPSTLGCKPGAYACRCGWGGKECWLEVCNALGRWQTSANCRDRSSPNGPETCRNGPNDTAYCI
ncbi:hypothetical protein ACJ72_07999 [Emergomyces africanus]|uniref:EGF-like domain-containing protein n=1 Tax=Emergomyces africanus TaxID=1955775 RepID=A0A1B7NLJ5_9EURO|nr:hypothetical protein ACJ72_07999 [Emergomyces africanus]